jgi:lipoprotein-anchoring transpeptidase ErfK/SrfK
MHLIRPASRGATVAIAALALVVIGGAVFAATQLHSHSAANVAAAPPHGAAPTVSVAGLRHGRVGWNRHLVVRAEGGSFRSVEVSYAGGDVLDGRMSDGNTRWTSATTLVPTTRYRVHAVLTGGGHTVTSTTRVRATNSTKHLTAILSPNDTVVGVGSPVIVQLSRAVPASQRKAVEERLAVSTTPSVVGAWHWMSDQELHWRPPTYWKAHTKVTVTSRLGGLYLGHGIWGEGVHQAAFRIGDSHISRVDVGRHQMYVYDNGKLIETFPISAGRTKYPTKNGVHITFEKSPVVTMDSATVGIPRNSPDGYYEKVYWDVRISYGGAFVHAAPWSVAEQGISNVSHGCVNISTTNAEWFYNYSLHGDIVDVYNSSAAPDTADPGMSDWNMSWKQWVAGDADPTAAALALHPRLPHDADPPAPKSSVPVSQPSYPPPSSSPTPSPKPTKQHSPTPTPSPSHKPHH